MAVVDPKHLGELAKETLGMGGRSIAVDRCLELDEAPEPVDLVDVDSNPLPDKESSTFPDHGQYAQNFVERRPQESGIRDRHKPEPALAILGPIGSPVGDQLGPAGFLTQLESTLA